MTKVGCGIYLGITWEIYRYPNNLCCVAILPIFLLKDKHAKEYIAENGVYFKDGQCFWTDILYKRKACREVARILCTNLWKIYGRYSYGTSFCESTITR